jgi:hypothetical protein
VQLARSLGAVVHDATGSPIPGVLVEEFSSDWKETLRSTKTDTSGGFTFAPVKGRGILLSPTHKVWIRSTSRPGESGPEARHKSATQNGSRYLTRTALVIPALTPGSSRYRTSSAPGRNSTCTIAAFNQDLEQIAKTKRRKHNQRLCPFTTSMNKNLKNVVCALCTMFRGTTSAFSNENPVRV